MNQLEDRLGSNQHRRGLLLSERRLLLTSFDVIAVGVAFIVAFNLRTAIVRDVGFYVPRLGTVIVVAIWLVSAMLAGAYEVRGTLTLRGALRNVGVALTITTIGLLAVFFIVPYNITRPTILLWIPFAGVGTMLARILYRKFFGGHSFTDNVVLIAPRETVEAAWPEMNHYLEGLYHVAAYINPQRGDCATRLESVINPRSIDGVIVGVRDNVSRDLFVALVGCHERGITVRSLADVYEELTGRLFLDQLGHTWLMALPMRNETSRLYATFKRLTDIGGAILGFGLFILMLPIVTIMIVIEDRGPLFYRQTRVGKYGKKFQVTKFRTMHVGAGSEWSTENDPRVTYYGRFLRRFHLDELPQTLAVLRGDMSLIGPRPEQPRYVEALTREIDFYATRHTVRPGLTGWAQVNFGYGSGADGAAVKLSYDLYYIKHQSVSLDLAIMARTAAATFAFRGR